MANISTILADLKSGRCSSMVEVRLLRFWEARKIKRGGHLMVVGMLILDSKVNLTFKVMFVIVLNSSLVFRFIFNRIMMSILSLSSLWYGFESSFKLCDFCFKMFSGTLMPPASMWTIFPPTGDTWRRRFQVLYERLWYH